jgi:GNAT superfamily N-acetyltransferase
MNWPTAQELTAMCPLEDGYSFEVLSSGSVSELMRALATWEPSWHIGAASAYLRRDFYETSVSLQGEAPRDVFVLLIRHEMRLAGMLSAKRNFDTRSLFGSLAVVAPEQRGKGGAKFKGDYLEAMARPMGLEFIFSLATLKHRGSQRYFESMGYKLVGIVPGYDCEEITPGVIKRVQEALYAKVLVTHDALLQPDLANMTSNVRRLYETLFPAANPANAA